MKTKNLNTFMYQTEIARSHQPTIYTPRQLIRAHYPAP